MTGMTPKDRVDLIFLGMANEKRKFAVALGARFTDEEREAFERGLDNDWFALIDIGPIDASAELGLPPRTLMKIFRLTNAGVARLAEIQKN